MPLKNQTLRPTDPSNRAGMVCVRRLVRCLFGWRERKRVRDILTGMARVHADNMSRMVADRGGDLPKCKPKIGTHYCMRCGRDVTTNNAKSSACPAIPPERRWRMTYNTNKQ